MIIPSLLKMLLLFGVGRSFALKKWSMSLRGGHIGRVPGTEGVQSSTSFLEASGRREILALDFDGVLCKIRWRK